MLPSFSRARIADLSLLDLFLVLVKLTFSEVGMCVLQLANLVICEILEKVAVLSIAAGFLANGGVMDTL